MPVSAGASKRKKGLGGGREEGKKPPPLWKKENRGTGKRGSRRRKGRGTDTR